ncbi:hypothetical protein SFRURICE_018397, partial [Spodoptera frugiperda]
YCKRILYVVKASAENQHRDSQPSSSGYGILAEHWPFCAVVHGLGKWVGRRVGVRVAVVGGVEVAAAAAPATGSWRADVVVLRSARGPCAGVPPRLMSEPPLWGSRGRALPNLERDGVLVCGHNTMVTVGKKGCDKWLRCCERCERCGGRNSGGGGAGGGSPAPPGDVRNAPVLRQKEIISDTTLTASLLVESENQKTSVTLTRRQVAHRHLIAQSLYLPVYKEYVMDVTARVNPIQCSLYIETIAKFSAGRGREGVDRDNEMNAGPRCRVAPTFPQCILDVPRRGKASDIGGSGDG